MPRSRPLTFATFMPSRVLILIKSDSNSAIITSSLKRRRPTGSVESCREPPMIGLHPASVSAWRMLRGVVNERSSLVTTKGVGRAARRERFAQPGTSAVGADQGLFCGHCSTTALRERYTFAMSVVIRQSELRNDNAAVMRRVAEGESFVVTVNGRPVADVVPHHRGTGRRRFVPVAELAEAFAAGPVSDPTAWRNDLTAAEEIFGPDEPSDPFDRERP